MKQALLLTLIVAGNIFAMEPLFQVEYTNYAWGYDNRGCMIDREGNIYSYGYGHSSNGKGIVNIGKVSQSKLTHANKLAEKAQLGKFTTTIVGADGGSTLWSATTEYGHLVELQLSGDSVGTNTSPEASELVAFLDGVCHK